MSRRQPRMRKPAVLVAALALAMPLAAQQPQPPQTTTSINRGDQNTSINATATGLNQQPQPTTPIREPGTPREPGSTARTTAPRTTTTTAAREPALTPQERASFAANSDVYLEVPNLSVEQILLDVDNVQVHLALDARVANLVSLKAGADASIGRVKLEI